MLPSFNQAPQQYARLSGWMYLAIIVLGIYGEMVVRGSLWVSGDPATTTNNIAAAELLWRSGMAADLLMQMLDLPVIVIFYYLLKPVSRGLALFATAINLIQTAVLATNKINMVVPLLTIQQASSASAMTATDLNALAYMALQTHTYGFAIGLIFFGVACLVRGYLMMHSGYFPRVLGALLCAAGASYLVNSFALILAPKLFNAISPAILAPAFIGELSVALWLIIKGIDRDGWAKRRGAGDGAVSTAKP